VVREGKGEKQVGSRREGKVGPGAGLPQEITDMKEWAAFATAVWMALLVQMLILGL